MLARLRPFVRNHIAIFWLNILQSKMRERVALEERGRRDDNLGVDETQIAGRLMAPTS